MPNVVVRCQYHEKGSSHRAFYDSSQKDDYLAYMDKGIKSTKSIDYLDYTGNEEKSSGIFNANGVLFKEDKKALRESLRKTESIIWDVVISFEEQYGNKNMYNAEQAQELLRKILPKFFREIGFKPENITWYAGLHTNTDNQHIHLSFFENEPMWYDRQKKEYRYRRKGKIRKECFDTLKMDIEKHFLQPSESIKRVRKLLTEEARTVTGVEAIVNYPRDLKRLLRKLYKEIPYESKTAYESENMSRLRGTVDSIVTLILTHGYHSADYKMAMLEIGEKDKAITEIAKSHKIQNVEPYLYTDKIQRDLYRRMGNAVIKEVLKKRRDELIKVKEIRHAKSRQKHHIDSLAYCLQKSADIAAEADREAIECFEEYRRKIELAEIERKMKALEM